MLKSLREVNDLPFLSAKNIVALRWNDEGSCGVSHIPPIFDPGYFGASMEDKMLLISQNDLCALTYHTYNSRIHIRVKLGAQWQV